MKWFTVLLIYFEKGIQYKSNTLSKTKVKSNLHLFASLPQSKSYGLVAQVNKFRGCRGMLCELFAVVHGMYKISWTRYPSLARDHNVLKNAFKMYVNIGRHRWMFVLSYVSFFLHGNSELWRIGCKGCNKYAYPHFVKLLTVTSCGRKNQSQRIGELVQIRTLWKHICFYALAQPFLPKKTSLNLFIFH